MRTFGQAGRRLLGMPTGIFASIYTIHAVFCPAPARDDTGDGKNPVGFGCGASITSRKRRMPFVAKNKREKQTWPQSLQPIISASALFK